MHRTPALTLAAILLAGSGALAQMPSPASHVAADVQAGTYRFDPRHTEVMFDLSHLGFSEYFGRFGEAKGTLKIDPQRIGETQLDVAVPIASVSTTSTALDSELQQEKWLDAGHFPEMRFHSTRVTATGPGHARIDGELTLHGVTRPLSLDARFVGAGVNPMSKSYTAGFQATGDLKRSDYGVKTFLPLIGDDIHLNIAASLEKSPA